MTVAHRLVRESLICAHREPVPWETEDVPCGWSGVTDVAVFDDTREALWWCPNGHENSEQYGEYS